MSVEVFVDTNLLYYANTDSPDPPSIRYARRSEHRMLVGTGHRQRDRSWEHNGA